MSTSLLHIDLLLICSVHSFDQVAPLPLQRAVSDGQLLRTDVTADDIKSDNFKLSQYYQRRMCLGSSTLSLERHIQQCRVLRRHRRARFRSVIPSWTWSGSVMSAMSRVLILGLIIHISKLFPKLAMPKVSRIFDFIAGQTYPATSLPALPVEGTFPMYDDQLDSKWEQLIRDEPRLDPGTYHPGLKMDKAFLCKP
jgi:hypothetical protein